MFALSRDGEKVFLHQPDAGMVVPVLLDLENKTLTVRVPRVDELENDYAVYNEFSEMLVALSHSDRDQVRLARNFSQECSKTFRDQLLTGKLTVSDLRKLVEGDITRGAASQSKVIPAQAYATMEAHFTGSFSKD